MGAWRTATRADPAQGQRSGFEACEDFDTKRFSNPLWFYFNQGLSYIRKSLQSLGAGSS